MVGEISIFYFSNTPFLLPYPIFLLKISTAYYVFLVMATLLHDILFIRVHSCQFVAKYLQIKYNPRLPEVVFLDD